MLYFNPIVDTTSEGGGTGILCLSPFSSIMGGIMDKTIKIGIIFIVLILTICTISVTISGYEYDGTTIDITGTDESSFTAAYNNASDGDILKLNNDLYFIPESSSDAM